MMIPPKEAVSHKCLFGQRPRLASKFYSSPTQVSLSVAKTFSEKKEVFSKKIENKVSLHNTGRSVIPRNTGKKGEGGKNAVIEKQEINACCLQDTDKLSESAHGDEGDTNDEDGNPKKDTRAPLELMAEFLRAEMGRDYHLAKKLCQMILIYEPENLEAKEFSLLIEEILLKEEAQNPEGNEEDEEDSSTESEEESSEDTSAESADEYKDGS
ncbi:glutamate-rich protein 2 isoform X1 [Octodon degus]|uniref:Glutamate-rich protein 2 isoform X1 n=1 Tax=Octodon degus TaxID=10160 RepID=A0A6P6ESI6_OCTDE|nr:glutamate-rich protein 2 isoform X1 [Octodon degus]XP_023574958.1 glutamate-rich protein 2 isoform X1 [Octodon degus]XP_023574959.1 glutamate-rich protein 2 isoform X1 [Octodon degus]XP_023574960.1 glutamate-rich protein 2 isoform X1 [Octodon degus]